MKNIIVLGATGSIGDSVLSIIKQNKNKLNLLGITFNSNISKAKDIINEFKLKNVYSESDENQKSLKHAFKDNYELNIQRDKAELEELLNKDDVDIIVSAVSGFAGLESTIMAAKTGKTILLANKESIVVAGDIVLPMANKHSTQIIPIDSEHNAIFQCLDSDKNTDDVSKIIITASGGPFLNKKISQLSKVTKKEALSHPNWEMGAKISIDSASLVNKCLELIEAKYLFNLNEEYFDLVIHPQSIIHSIVTYIDGSSICQMSNPDMRVPIAHALSVHEKRLSLNFSEIDFSSLKLTFEDIPEDRSELVNIARDICNLGGSSGAIFNAANEIAVQSFLEEQITFDKIYEVIYRTFDAIPMSKNIDINTIYETDNQTRIEAKKVVKSIS
jgi:1-deoxy-D-xylulose-5-phosphate reductoisomerase